MLFAVADFQLWTLPVPDRPWKRRPLTTVTSFGMSACCGSWINYNAVDAGLRDDLAGMEFSARVTLPKGIRRDRSFAGHGSPDGSLAASPRFLARNLFG
jgi:hypothetical protein